MFLASWRAFFRHLTGSKRKPFRKLSVRLRLERLEDRELPTVTAAASSTPYSVTVTASDSTFSATGDFDWTVMYLELGNPGPQAGVDSGTFSLALTALNASGDTASFSATGLPSGLSINSSTGVISGTLASTADADSGYFVTATVTAGAYSNSQVFALTVTKVGMVNPGDQTNIEGATVALTVSAATGSGTLTFSATGLPDGLSINSSTGEITGTVAASDAALSPYAVTVVASNGTNAASQALTWNVTAVVTLAAVSDRTNAEGDSVSLALSATDADSATLTYSADGLPSGLSINSSTGAVSGTVATGDFAAGPQYVAELTASDGTYSASQLVVWTIANPDESGTTLTNPGTQSNQPGDQVDFFLAGSVPNGENTYFSATGLPDGLYLDCYAGEISGTIAEDAVSTSPYSVTVSITDGMGNTATQTFNWFLSTSSLSTASGSAISVSAGASTGTVTLANFTTPDLNTQASTFTVAVNWGDGGTGDAWIEGSDGSYTVVGGYTYAAAGTYTVSVTVTNPSGSTSGANTSVTATVGDGTLTATGGFQVNAVQGQAITAKVATFTDTNLLAPASSFTATIGWGDGSSDSTGTVTEPEPGIFAVSGTHTYTSTGTDTITITVDSSGGATASTTSSAVVTSTQSTPPLTLTADNITYTPAVAFSGILVGSFTDPNTSDTTSDFSGSLSWGDGSSPDTSVTITGGNGLFNVYAGHDGRIPKTCLCRCAIASFGTLELWLRRFNGDVRVQCVKHVWRLPCPIQSAVAGHALTHPRKRFLPAIAEHVGTNHQ